MYEIIVDLCESYKQSLQIRSDKKKGRIKFKNVHAIKCNLVE